ncbi:hypothetical protein AB9Q10_41685 [Streptomyces krungchingensis]|uniref:hypothetical protein n=1 Tax=Streptomyces krungchingensis TaxID=1565034 RepID=UPI003CEF2C6B
MAPLKILREAAPALVLLDRTLARLKSWRIFHHARCSPKRMSSIAAAVLTLERQR